MRGKSVSAFGEPDDYLAALRQVGYETLLVLRPKLFRATSTVLTLRHLSLCCAEERAARIATLTLAPHSLRILLPPDKGHVVCGGLRVDQGQLVTLGSGASVHERLDGPCRWRDIVVSERHLARYSQALTGTAITLPPTVRTWHPPPAALRSLTALHAAATRVTRADPGKAAGATAAHGLEQQLTDRLVLCLSTGTGTGGAEQTGTQRNAAIIANLERSIEAHSHEFPGMATICRELDSAERTLRRVCQQHLGISPTRYIRLRRMQLVRRALQNAAPDAVTVTQVVRQHGFHELGRFATSYREYFGELPSATLRQ